MQEKNKTIFIIGAGAIGKALAVFLSQKGKDIVLLRGHITDVQAYVETIEVELDNGKIIQSNVPGSAVGNYSALNGIIVLTTKAHSNQQVAEYLSGKIGDSPVIVLQNGLNVETAFSNNLFPEIYRCVLFTSCQYTGNNRLRFRPASVSPVGIVRGNREGLTMIIENLSNPWLIFQAEENIQPVIWTKAIINCVFNSICPLLEIDNGVFWRYDKALKLAKRIVDECVIVAAAEGILLNADRVVEKLLLISKSSDGQLISTYQDIIHRRKTEIESLNVAIARIADKLEVKGLAKETGLLGELIQIKSEIAMQFQPGRLGDIV